MNEADSRLQRLLKTAAQAPVEDSAPVPFGFDTRVVALWRADRANGGANGVLRLVRRVAAVAAFLILVSGAASFHEYQATRDIIEPGNNEFAIADSAIQTEFDQ